MTEIQASSHDRSERRRPDGPHPGILAMVALVLTLLGLILGGVLSGGATLSSPFGAAPEVAARFHEYWLATRISGWLIFGSAVPLGIYTATIYARQLRLGVRVPGAVIALFGGLSASLMLMLAGLLTWVLSRPEITTDARLTQALDFFTFMLGGVGFVGGIGLLIAGIAVPACILRFVPRWFAIIGLVIAALSELSFLAMVAEPFQYLLPVGRFGGLIWLVIVGFLLPRNRAAANSARET